MAAVSCPVCVHLARARGAARHWSYERTEGPENWGKLEEGYRACSIRGTQSPIDIVEANLAILPPVSIAHGRRITEIVHNGHKIQVNIPLGSTVTLGKLEYQLVQFLFHRPSEHLLNGKSVPMEVHFVNKSSEARLGVVGVLMTAPVPVTPASIARFATLCLMNARPAQHLLNRVINQSS